MPRRVNLPGADEIFRPTTPGVDGSHASPRAASGRVKHDEKMTIYLTSDELLAVEQARLQMRGLVGRKVDRGKLVRTALALALQDLDENGDESAVVKRLREA